MIIFRVEHKNNPRRGPFRGEGWLCGDECRLIRHMLVTFQLRHLMRMIWDEHERIFYEDNAPTRRAHIEDMIP